MANIVLNAHGFGNKQAPVTYVHVDSRWGDERANAARSVGLAKNLTV
jgi:hypothetical protein